MSRIAAGALKAFGHPCSHGGGRDGIVGFRGERAQYPLPVATRWLSDAQRLHRGSPRNPMEALEWEAFMLC